MLDKDYITNNMKKPSYQVSIIKQPAKEEFIRVINDFWWDTTYVAKSLARDEIFYAKFMSENMIRTSYIIPLIEWYIASHNNWNITTNKYGRLFKKYLSPEQWERIEKTFSGSSIEDNWNALFAFSDLINEIGIELSETLGFPYPVELEKNIRKYLNDIKSQRKAEN